MRLLPTIEWDLSGSVSAGMGGFRSRAGVVQMQMRLLEQVKVETSVLEMLKERGLLRYCDGCWRWRWRKEKEKPLVHLLARPGEATTAAEVHAQLLLADAAPRARSKGTALLPRSRILAVASAWPSSASILYCRTLPVLSFDEVCAPSLSCSVTSDDLRFYCRKTEKKAQCAQLWSVVPLCIRMRVGAYTSTLVTPGWAASPAGLVLNSWGMETRLSAE